MIWECVCVLVGDDDAGATVAKLAVDVGISQWKQPYQVEAHNSQAPIVAKNASGRTRPEM